MWQVNRIDANGMFVEPIVLEDGQTLTEAVTDANGNVTYQPRADIITVSVPEGFHHPKWDGTQWVEGKTDAELLQIAKQKKLDDLDVAYNTALTTFKSNGLDGTTMLTYLIGQDDKGRDYMTLFNGKFSFINSALYNGNPFLWFTFEQGNVNHTKQQFEIVYQDGQNHVESVHGTKAQIEANISAATTMADLDAIQIAF